MTYQEQSDLLCSAFRNEREKLKNMPEEEARKRAMENLVRIGLFNADGSPAKPYANV